MINKKLIESKLKDIKVYQKEIEPVLKFSNQEIIKDHLKLRTIERDLQLIVDTMVDINSYIISQKKLQPFEDFQSTFIILGKNKILPMEFALKIAPIVGLRNKVVHKYGKVDIKKLLDNIKKGFSDFNAYIKHINKFLKKKVV